MGQMKTYTFKRSAMTPDCLVGFEDGEQFFHTSFTDYEPDNQKIFHEIWHLSLPEKYIFMMDWSPYSMPESLDLEMFLLWAARLALLLMMVKSLAILLVSDWSRQWAAIYV